jgi:hypothetical protein
MGFRPTQGMKNAKQNCHPDQSDPDFLYRSATTTYANLRKERRMYLSTSPPSRGSGGAKRRDLLFHSAVSEVFFRQSAAQSRNSPFFR